MLSQITPVILTKNEAPNIDRNLQKLSWAADIVIVDSFSTDETLDIVRRYDHARLFQNPFEMLSTQWNFAIKHTSISTPWVLALDADYILSDELLTELSTLKPKTITAGYKAHFRYCIHGTLLRHSLYPPKVVLFRHSSAVYKQNGHAETLSLPGHIETLNNIVVHDDRKSLTRWLRSQSHYMSLEARKLQRARWRELAWTDRIRKMRFISPAAMFFYCLLIRGNLLDGRAGIYYAIQRALAEGILTLHLFNRDLTQSVNRKL